MTDKLTALTAIVTTDLAAITRGRSIPERQLDHTHGVGWVPANLSLTAFGEIASPNPWSSTGDLRILPEREARYRTSLTGAETPFDMVMGSIVEMDGAPWECCPRQILKDALDDLRTTHGLTLLASFEQEFQLAEAALASPHPFSLAALREADPFPSRLMGALEEAGIEPEMVIAEYGRNQFEAVCAPADGIVAADRAVAVREITREVARCLGWRASFAPKTALDAPGNGVHVHFSFLDTNGRPVLHDPAAPSGLSTFGSAFCAGVLRHMRALTFIAAPSVPSYYRLQPNNWSAAWTWLADRDREASLRICPVVTKDGRDPAPQYNIEFRAADATANPYLVLAAIIRAGLEGMKTPDISAPIVSENPERLDEPQREKLGLQRLPESVAEAQAAWERDETAQGWFAPKLLQTLLGVRRAEMAKLSELDANEICRIYGELY